MHNKLVALPDRIMDTNAAVDAAPQANGKARARDARKRRDASSTILVFLAFLLLLARWAGADASASAPELVLARWKSPPESGIVNSAPPPTRVPPEPQ